MNKKIVIAGSCRTAIGKMSGMLSTVPVAKLGEVVIREAVRRAGIQPSDVDMVYMGCIYCSMFCLNDYYVCNVEMA